MEGLVIRITGLQCLVWVDKKIWLCELRGRLKQGLKRTNSPVVAGDKVLISQASQAKGVVEYVYPRTSKISRVASGSRPFEQILAANVDRFIVIVAVKNPKIRPGFIDRALIIAMKNDILPVLCFNKVDLGISEQVKEIAELYQKLGYHVVFTSAKSDAGKNELKDILTARVSTLVGQSGVGKSSLINRIDPHLNIKTQDMMRKHDRGRHTTTTVQLHPLGGGGFVADTPGIKELKPWEMSKDDLEAFFIEMHPFNDLCKFRNCTHLHEPGCAVLEAVKNKQIDSVRLESYRRFYNEVVQKESHE